MSIVGRWHGHMPTESWWLDALHFYQRAKREQERMRLSWYGQTDNLHTGVDVTPAKPRKTAKVVQEAETV